MKFLKDQILALIPKLTSQEAGEVQAALSAVGGLNKVQPMNDASQDWVLLGFVVYLSRRGLITRKGALSLSRSKSYKAYSQKLPVLMEYLGKLEKQATTTTRHRPKLAFVCAKALAEFLEERNIFSVSTMLSQIDKVPEALDKSFPGYMRAGLFRYVLDNYAEETTPHD